METPQCGLSPAIPPTNFPPEKVPIQKFQASNPKERFEYPEEKEEEGKVVSGKPLLAKELD